jgi:hypothetical protein
VDVGVHSLAFGNLFHVDLYLNCLVVLTHLLLLSAIKPETVVGTVVTIKSDRMNILADVFTPPGGVVSQGKKVSVIAIVRYWPNRAAYDAHSVEGKLKQKSDWISVVTATIEPAVVEISLVVDILLTNVSDRYSIDRIFPGLLRICCLRCFLLFFLI